MHYKRFKAQGTTGLVASPRPSDIAEVIGGVAKIPLRGGHVALIDAGDLPLVDEYSLWVVRRHRRWYVAAAKRPSGATPTTYLHRVIAGAEPGLQVDHENLDGLDNRRGNLRIATPQLNMANIAKVSRRTSSSYKGVYRHGKNPSWIAQLKFNGRCRTSSWPTEEEAARAYDAMATEAFGAFARLNFPRPEPQQLRFVSQVRREIQTVETAGQV
jgi:hypothetical protein